MIWLKQSNMHGGFKSEAANSSMSIAFKGERIVYDPWVGKAKASGWQNFPEFSTHSLAANLADVRRVYVSHLHDDQFHPDPLKS